MDAKNILEVNHLTKKYNRIAILADISFSLSDSAITVLKGSNGSGKTTLLSCITGLVRPTDGKVKVCGYDLYDDELEVHRRMAYVPDVPRFYTELTAYEHLEFIASMHKVLDGFDARSEELLRKLGLWSSKDLYPHTYSRGMRLKLGLALAFIRPFDLLLLDEPTSALDVEGVELLVDLLKEYRNSGKVILMSTHDGDFAGSLADSTLAIKDGCLIGAGIEE